MRNVIFPLLLLLIAVSNTANAETAPEMVAKLDKAVVGKWTFEASGKKCKKGQKITSSFGSDVPCSFKGEIEFKADHTFGCTGTFKGGLECSEFKANTWAAVAGSSKIGKLRMQYKILKSGAFSVYDWDIDSIDDKNAVANLFAHFYKMKKK